MTGARDWQTEWEKGNFLTKVEQLFRPERHHIVTIATMVVLSEESGNQ
jgi:hypothetical protein